MCVLCMQTEICHKRPTKRDQLKKTQQKSLTKRDPPKEPYVCPVYVDTRDIPKEPYVSSIYVGKRDLSKEPSLSPTYVDKRGLPQETYQKRPTKRALFLPYVCRQKRPTKRAKCMSYIIKQKRPTKRALFVSCVCRQKRHTKRALWKHIQADSTRACQLNVENLCANWDAYLQEIHQKRLTKSDLYVIKRPICVMIQHVCMSQSSRELGCAFASIQKRPTKRGQYRKRDPYV